MVRYGMSDELGASYAGTLLFCARACLELGPLLLSCRCVWVKSASFVFNAWRRFMFRRFMFMDGERVMVMDDGDGELCLGGSSE